MRTELLGWAETLAELVDPTDGSILHDGPFVMHGSEWQIESVQITGDLIRVMCGSTSDIAAEAQRTASQRVSQ